MGTAHRKGDGKHPSVTLPGMKLGPKFMSWPLRPPGPHQERSHFQETFEKEEFRDLKVEWVRAGNSALLNLGPCACVAQGVPSPTRLASTLTLFCREATFHAA